MSSKDSLIKKISDNKEVVGIIGLGYVGLPLAVSFAQAGVKVIGFDKNNDKVGKINRGDNYIKDIRDATLREVVLEKITLIATSDFSKLRECDAILICVPTPLDSFKKPDMHFIQDACEEIAKNMKSGTFISLESTTFPTTTEEYMLPIIEQNSGLKHNIDFWLSFSPERVDPGNINYHTKNTPKIIGALSDDGLEIGLKIYSKAIDKMYPVSSPRVAEMVKILENTYRLVNISLINELALLAGKMNINIWEVIEAANSKPFGFHAFYPGPGIGGHCIPLDPFYLEYIAKKYDFDLSMINTAGHINMRMPHYMYIKIATALNQQSKSVSESNLLFLGVSYKPNIDDERESPALKIMDIAFRKGANIQYHDPFVSRIKTELGISYNSKILSDKILKESDCVIITTNHDCFDGDYILKNSKLVVDLRNLIKTKSEKIYKL